MVDAVRESPSVVHRGIDTIVREPALPASTPDMRGPALSEAPDQPHLEQLLALPNLDEFIAAQLLPGFSDPRVLTPQQFRAVLHAAPMELRAAAERNPEAGRALGRAARELTECIDRHGLLHMYRTALLQG